MLCFVFAALIVALDQFFKQWVKRTLEIGEAGQELIPGVLGLTRWENDGAMLNILSGQQWLLAGIAFAAAIVLIMILLRYNEGFWGTLGLAAVLGGAVGNLVDRIFNDGRVIDMFRTLPVDFPIFNIADIFITLGVFTFLIHFIVITFKSERHEKTAHEYADDEYDEEYDEQEYDEFPEIDSAIAAQAEQGVYPDSQYSSQPQYPSEPQYAPESQYAEQAPYTEQPSYPQDQQYYPDTDMTNDYESITDTTPDSSFSLDALEMELGSLDDYDVDDLLREYGLDDDESYM